MQQILNNMQNRQPFNGLFLRPWVSQYQKIRTILDFKKKEPMGWQWHQPYKNNNNNNHLTALYLQLTG